MLDKELSVGQVSNGALHAAVADQSASIGPVLVEIFLPEVICHGGITFFSMAEQAVTKQYEATAYLF